MNDIVASIIFLSSGLFMGWSLGANDAGNIFGAAVGTRMIKFRTAAIICCIFVIFGAVTSGNGTTQTLGQLGSVNAIAGSFTVSFAAAFSVMMMVKRGLPVSTSQAIVGSIIGWNLFTNSNTDMDILYKIVSTWVLTPALGAILAIIFYFIAKYILENLKIHLLKLDKYTRIGLIIVGAFGSYSLGANNIANVMGVFINVSPFSNINISDMMTISSTQQLFLLGAIAISVGVVTYSKRVMKTVGSNIYKLSPITACLVVLSSSTVLFLLSSTELKVWLMARSLPSFPLVPVSLSQAVVGSILGIGIAKGGKNVNFKILAKIGLGWVINPIFAMMLSYTGLFLMQNIFMQVVVNF